MSAPTFSVVIPCHNYARYLGLALDSVYDQGRSDVEILVVDDASTDETPEVIRRYPAIRYVRLDENVGPGGAWAIGIDAARGRFVAKLDADDWLLPGWFDAVEEAFETDVEVGLVAGASVLYRSAHDLMIWRVTRQDCVLDPAELRHRLLRRFFFRMPSVCLRAAALDGHALPRGELRLGHDWEYFLRTTRDWKGHLLGQLLGVYRVHGGSVTVTSQHNRLLDDFRRFQGMIDDPDDPAFLQAEEQTVLTSAMAKTYLGIVGPQLTLRRPSEIREHLAAAFEIARRGGARSVAGMPTRLVTGAWLRARQSLPWRWTDLTVEQLLPSGYDEPETRGLPTE